MKINFKDFLNEQVDEWDPFGEETKPNGTNIVLELLDEKLNGKYYIGVFDDMRKAYWDGYIVLYTEKDDRYVLYFWLNNHGRQFESHIKQRYGSKTHSFLNNKVFGYELIILK